MTCFFCIDANLVSMTYFFCPIANKGKDVKASVGWWTVMLQLILTFAALLLPSAICQLLKFLFQGKKIRSVWLPVSSVFMLTWSILLVCFAVLRFASFGPYGYLFLLYSC